MKVANMKAEPRTAIGRNQTQHLRKEGWLPAVVYGQKKESIAISISQWEFEQHIKHHHKVYALDIGGQRQDAFLQDLQFNVLNDQPLHVDFRRIDLNEAMDVQVEITLIGHPVGLGKGGTLLKDNLKITISCLPTAIPEVVEVAIGHLDAGEALLAKDLALPDGVKLAVPDDTIICRVSGEAAPAPEEGEEGAEGDDKPAE